MTFSKRICAYFSIAILSLPCLACEVPVFSYAMQYWGADPYRVTIFHEGALPPSEAALLETFEAVARHDALETNMDVQTVNIAATNDSAVLEMQRSHLKDVLPGVIVQYPVSTRIETPVYAGPLADSLLHDLLDSPMRRDIIRGLIAGKVAVWILLESGNRREDAAAAEMLEKELRRMEQVLKLPEQELWVWSDEIRAAVEGGSGIRFPVLRVSRDAPEEWFFVQMLLNSEVDLIAAKRAPMAFPIYGRGLILHALVGSGINEWTIADACEFITGPCSCEAKASNPGTDLLLSANWSQHIGKTRYDQPAPLAGFSDFFARGEIAAAQLAKNDANESLKPEDGTQTAMAVSPGLLNPSDSIAVFEPEPMASVSRANYWIFAAVLAVGVLAAIFLSISYHRLIRKE